MTQSIKLAEYLFSRLRQVGIEAVHGVPGDYNLDLLDYVQPSGLLWVGNTNELNAGYAADGYARIKGIGALITTFGVGELSAINAIACSFTERAAVIHIVGTPSRTSQGSRSMIHHTLGDGDFRHFSQMYSHVSAAQTNLTNPSTAPEQIDEALRQCLVQSRPVYIEVPVDMVDVQVPAENLRSSVPLFDAVPDSDSSLSSVLSQVLERMYKAERPCILVDGETRALGLLDAVQQLVYSTKWPTFTTIAGKCLIDMTSANVYGIYRGSYADSKTRAFVESSDLILCFGPHFSSTNSYNWSAVPNPERTVLFSFTGVQFGHQVFEQVSARQLVRQLVDQVKFTQLQESGIELDMSRDHLLSFAGVDPNEAIRQDKVWRLLASFVRPGDILLGETGTAGYGVREMALPKHTSLLKPITWLSIGYMLPASQGAALAQRELISANKYNDLKKARTILLIGDGSFQMTVQELATIVRHNLNVVVFLINNGGYTIERCIHGKDEGYNDVSSWRYLRALSLFGAPDDSYTGTAKTYGELEKVLKDPKLAEGNGLRMVEVSMDRNDAPAGPLLDMMNQQYRTKE